MDQQEAIRMEMQQRLQTMVHEYIEKLADAGAPGPAMVAFREVAAFAGDIAWRMADSTRNHGLADTDFETMDDIEEYLMSLLFDRATEVFSQIENGENVLFVDEQ